MALSALVRQAIKVAAQRVGRGLRPIRRQQLGGQLRVMQRHAPELVYEQRAQDEALLRRRIGTLAERTGHTLEARDETAVRRRQRFSGPSNRPSAEAIDAAPVASVRVVTTAMRRPMPSARIVSVSSASFPGRAGRASRPGRAPRTPSQLSSLRSSRRERFVDGRRRDDDQMPGAIPRIRRRGHIDATIGMLEAALCPWRVSRYRLRLPSCRAASQPSCASR